MRGRIFYFGLVVLDKILARETRVSPQLSGCGRRTPPTVMLSACSSHSTGPGHGVFFEVSMGRGGEPLLTASAVSSAHTSCSPRGAISLEWGSLFPTGPGLAEHGCTHRWFHSTCEHK